MACKSQCMPVDFQVEERPIVRHLQIIDLVNLWVWCAPLVL